MNDHEALLRAICEQPDEDTPRLVFADWLTELGGAVNTAWANGIRAQVWLARGATNAAFGQQSKVFETPYGLAKVQERLGIPPGLGVWGWERGFPTSIGGQWENVSAAWPRIAFRVPVQRLHLYDAADATAASVAKFVGWPGLSGLRELYLQVHPAASFFVSDLRALAGCSGLAGLEELSLGFVHLTDDGARAVLDSPYLANVRRLRLDRMYSSQPLSPEVADEVHARFGPDVFG